MTRPPSILAAGTITGTVFRDYNGNGVIDTSGTAPNLAIDKNLAGVTVTVYDSTGTAQGTTTSVYCTGSATPLSTCSSRGLGQNYSLSATGTGPYRIEFTWDNATAFPANALYGYQSGPLGTNNTSSVQFLLDGNSSNINFGVLQPADYSQNQPKLATALQTAGSRSATAAFNALVTFNYGESSALTTRANNDQIGSTWGLAYDRLRNKLYASALLKRHADLGPLGSGGVYEIDPTTGVPVTFVDLDTIAGAGIDTGDTSTPLTRNLSTTLGTADVDNPGFVWAGKYALGDIDISDDNSTLYIVNLFQRKLIALTIATKTVAAQYDLATLPSGAASCSSTNDLRPWGVKVYRDQVYVGVVCSAESTQIAGQMQGYVWRLSGSSFVNVMDFPLNYPRVVGSNETTRANDWHPWVSTGSPTSPVVFGAEYFDKYSQPTIADIEFDDRDNMFIGMLDRWGNQTGEQQIPPNGVAVDEAGASAGDILLACRSGGGWVLENGPSDTTCKGWEYAKDPSKSGGGPGSGEFVFSESNNENESSLGALALLHGTGKFTLTTGDPNCGNCGGVSYITAPLNSNPSLTDPDGQVNPTGIGGTAQDVGRFQVYGSGAGLWGKGTGMGDIELLSNPAPVEIGNRVWKDTNGNGRQDPGEAGISGVTVELLNASNVVISTVTTDASGNYLFSGAAGTDSGWADYNLALSYSTSYSVRVPNAEGPSRQAALTTAGVQYISAPLQNPNPATANAILRDSNGVKTASGGGNFSSLATVTTGGAGVNNHTIDFGFNNVAPTASLLDVFSGKNNGAKKVTLTWRTSTEVSTLGFDVLRSKKKNGNYRQLNAQIIPATALGQIRGADYVYQDKKLKNAKAFWYKLEILDASGKSNWSEPVKVQIRK